jgi:hypothetical protein
MFFGMFFMSLLMTPIMINNLADYRLSVSQIYMAIIMSSGMVLLEGTMHPLPAVGWILAAAGVIGGIVGYRWQIGVSDREYLHDMVPHHSMAVLTSKHVLERSSDKRIKQLAETILNAQVKEIALMKLL